MRLVVDLDAGLYRVFVQAPDGSRRVVLRSGDVPSWAGGWAGRDGAGGYEGDDALAVLIELGLDEASSVALLDRAATRTSSSAG